MFDHNVNPPFELRTEAFVLEPLGPQHNEPDYAAWSTSIDHIRSTPGFVPEEGRGDSWPYPMTVADNLADLTRHAAEFTAREGYAYTVLDPADGDVIGCVYIDPDDSDGADVQVRSWVRADRAALDGALAAAVDAWLAGPEWPAITVRWPGRPASP